MKDSKFYMVAPFLGPLKKWINQQFRKDAARTAPKLNNHLTQTEYQGAETDLTAGEDEDCADIVARELQMDGDNAVPPFADRPMDNSMNRLLSQLRSSADGPEAPSVPIAHSKINSTNSAEEGLKRLLSVGKPSQEPTNDMSNARSPKSDMLLSMLQGNATMTTSIEATETRVLDARSQQLISTITKNATNHIQSQKNTTGPTEPNRGPSLIQTSLAKPPVAQALLYQKQQSQLPNAGGIAKTEQNTQYDRPSQRLDQPYSHINDPLSLQPSNIPIKDLHKAPPASKLPPPKLNSHTLKLLNTLRQPTAKPFDVVSHDITNEKLIDNAAVGQRPLSSNSNFRPELEPQMGPEPVLEASLPYSSHIGASQNHRNGREHLAGAQVDTSQREKLISLLSASNPSSVPYVSAISDGRHAAHKTPSWQYPNSQRNSATFSSVPTEHIPHDTILPHRQDDRLKTNFLAPKSTPENIPDAAHKLRQMLKSPQSSTYPNDSDNKGCYAKTHQLSTLKPSVAGTFTHELQAMSTTLPHELSGSNVESSKLILNTKQTHPEPETRQIYQKQDIPAKSNHVPFLDRRGQVTIEHKSNLLSLFSNSTPTATGSISPAISEKFPRKTNNREAEVLRESNPRTSSAAQSPIKQDGATTLYDTIRPPASSIDRKFLLAYLEGVAKGGK